MSCLLFPVELVAVGSLTVLRPCVETGVPQGGFLCILAVVGSHARTSRDFQTIFTTPNKCLVDLVWLTGRYLQLECTWPRKSATWVVLLVFPLASASSALSRPFILSPWHFRPF